MFVFDSNTLNYLMYTNISFKYHYLKVFNFCKKMINIKLMDTL